MQGVMSYMSAGIVVDDSQFKSDEENTENLEKLAKNYSVIVQVTFILSYMSSLIQREYEESVVVWSRMCAWWVHCFCSHENIPIARV
jgi:hypothetical protein